ncbi:MAG TPA: hypothetical protein VGZ29_12220 [Terriglobia bacterium]|nr:hypothetical protein [Terriglobia bacterium]
MRKDLWIHLVGLLSLFAWALMATLFWASTISPDLTTRANVGILTFTSFAVAFLLTLLWAVLSLVQALDHPVARHGAARLIQAVPVASTSSTSKMVLRASSENDCIGVVCGETDGELERKKGG